MALQTVTQRLTPMALALAAIATAAMTCQQPRTVSSGAARATPTRPPVVQHWVAASPLPQQGGAPVIFTAAPSDGRVIYACGYAPAGYAAISHLWSSADSGVTWGVATSILDQQATGDCQITVDQFDPQRALASFDMVSPDPEPVTTNFTALLTVDGGADWSPQPGAGPRVIASLASYQDATFAAGSGLDGDGHTLTGVWTSHDGGATWAVPATNPLGATPHIWMNAQTGELIGESAGGLLPALWRSVDSGQTWLPITTPLLAGEGGWQSLLVAMNGEGWRLCVVAVTTAGPGGQNALACSTNLGVTWRGLSADNSTVAPPVGPSYTPQVAVYAIATDGGLLGVYTSGATGATVMAVIRLAPGATQWERLMPPPGANDMQTLPMESTGPGAGVITAVGRDSRAPVFTAVYP